MAVAIAILACLVSVGFYVEMRIKTDRARAQVLRMEELLNSPVLIQNTPVEMRTYPYFDWECNCVRLGPGGAFIDLEDYARIIVFLHKTYKSDDWSLLLNLLKENTEKGMSLAELNDLTKTIYQDIIGRRTPDYGTPGPVEDEKE